MSQETPILTKKQQKSSLSAKKKKSKQMIRHVLATPYRKYWPLISPERSAFLHEILSKYLPKIVPDKVRIPWQELKKIPKNERKTFRKQTTINSKETRQGLVFGVNDIAKAIEKGMVHSILIAHDVKPKIMVEHLLDLSVLLRIPTIIVPGLRDVLKSTCGISSVALALTDEDKFKEIQEVIKDLDKDFPVPRNHIHFQRSLDLANKIKNPLDTTDKSLIVIEDNSIIDTSVNDESLNENNASDSIYLYRDSMDKRVFIPTKSSHKVNTNIFQTDNLGFLSFSVAATSNIEQENYKSLKVKRIKGNNDRNKRKICELKKRKMKKINKNNQ